MIAQPMAWHEGMSPPTDVPCWQVSSGGGGRPWMCSWIQGSHRCAAVVSYSRCSMPLNKRCVATPADSFLIAQHPANITEHIYKNKYKSIGTNMAHVRTRAMTGEEACVRGWLCNGGLSSVSLPLPLAVIWRSAAHKHATPMHTLSCSLTDPNPNPSHVCVHPIRTGPCPPCPVLTLPTSSIANR